MKFKDYVKACNDLLEAEPTVGGFETVSLSDEECNSINIVNYKPCIGLYDEDQGSFEEGNLLNMNAVLIN